MMERSHAGIFASEITSARPRYDPSFMHRSPSMKYSLMTAACSAALLLTACNGPSSAAQNGDAAAPQAAPTDGKPLVSTEVATFDEPWAMTFLPDGRLLVSEKEGRLKLLDVDSKRV